MLPGVPLCLLEESRALISRCQCSKDDKPLWAVMYTRLKLIARRLRNKFWRWVIRSINFIKPCPDAAAAKIGGKFASKKTRENSTRKKQGKVRLEKDRGKFDSKKTGENSTRKNQGKFAGRASNKFYWILGFASWKYVSSQDTSNQSRLRLHPHCLSPPGAF